MSVSVDGDRVEHIYGDLQKLRRVAWTLPIPEVAALSERVRVELMIDKKLQGSVKSLYRAYSDYLDDVVEERAATEDQPRESFQKQVFEYVRGMLDPNGD